MDAAPTLPRILGEHGYLSLQTGKWWQGNFRRGGFTHGMTRGERHGDDGIEIGRKTMAPIFDFIDEARAQDKPFFVWYAPMMPHRAHNPPKRFLDKYRDKTPSEFVAKYWGMVEWFDSTCGTLINRLDQIGMLHNTIIVYVTDNGWIQDPSRDDHAPKCKQSPYDGGLRTPIMIRWPKGKVKPRMCEDELASSIDIAPTLLRAAGIEPPKEMTGVNLLDEAAVKARPAVFGECFTHNAVDLNNPASSLRWRWVIAGNWKLIAPDSKNEPGAGPELYDLSKDPHEESNLAANDPARVAGLSRQLDGWWSPSAPR
jgi:uncharacterized sulfatase